jgi:hypothetical protein
MSKQHKEAFVEAVMKAGKALRSPDADPESLAIEKKLTMNFQGSDLFVNSVGGGKAAVEAVLGIGRWSGPTLSELEEFVLHGSTAVGKERDLEVAFVKALCEKLPEQYPGEVVQRWDSKQGAFVLVCTNDAATRVEDALKAFRDERAACAATVSALAAVLQTIPKAVNGAGVPAGPAWAQLFAVSADPQGKIDFTGPDATDQMIAVAGHLNAKMRQLKLVKEGKMHPMADELLLELVTREHPAGQVSLQRLGEYLLESSAGRRDYHDFKNQYEKK